MKYFQSFLTSILKSALLVLFIFIVDLFTIIKLPFLDYIVYVIYFLSTLVTYYQVRKKGSVYQTVNTIVFVCVCSFSITFFYHISYPPSEIVPLYDFVAGFFYFKLLLPTGILLTVILSLIDRLRYSRLKKNELESNK